MRERGGKKKKLNYETHASRHICSFNFKATLNISIAIWLDEANSLVLLVV